MAGRSACARVPIARLRRIACPQQRWSCPRAGCARQISTLPNRDDQACPRRRQLSPKAAEMPGYGAPEWRANRKFNLDGREATGYDAAQDYLTEQAKRRRASSGLTVQAFRQLLALQAARASLRRRSPPSILRAGSFDDPCGLMGSSGQARACSSFAMARATKRRTPRRSSGFGCRRRQPSNVRRGHGQRRHAQTCRVGCCGLVHGTSTQMEARAQIRAASEDSDVGFARWAPSFK
jgi:hypothetical protein